MTNMTITVKDNESGEFVDLNITEDKDGMIDIKSDISPLNQRSHEKEYMQLTARIIKGFQSGALI